MATNAPKKGWEEKLGPALGYDPRFAQLDTRGLPGFDEQPEESFIDDRFGGLVNESHVNLRQALTDMAEKEGRDPDVARVLAEAGIENPSLPATVYVADKPFTIVFEQGLWRGEGVLNRVRHRLTAKSRDELINKLMALARKVKRETVIEELTETQLTEVARTAQRDRVQSINLYLSYAFPDVEENDAEQIVNDPRLADFLARVCEFVWLNSRLDATDSEDWQDYKSQFIGQRPVSCALLDNAWTEFSSSRNRLVFTPAREKPEPEAAATTEQLDDLSDEAVDKLMASTKREYVRAAFDARR